MIVTELLQAEAIRARLRTRRVGCQLYVLREVDSTNAQARRLARGGAPDGTAVLAEGQTAGRGRRGQPWFSPSGVNLYASVLLRPSLRPRDLGLFSLLPSLALADAVREAGAMPAIKWPNDVLVHDKKVGGSLMECALRGEEIDYVILGVGVNLNVDPEVLRGALGPSGAFATSLAAAVGHEIDRNAFAAAFLNHLDRRLDGWTTEGPSAVLRAWQERDILTGRRVEVRGRDARFEAWVVGLDPSGGLRVRDTLGHHHLLTSEEVRLLD
jgi:BirA family biotin operon repressor/biotin-[acetyl-CoA-carboxylase] ligase